MNAPLLVRDVMTIGVPVCRAAEPCGQVRARLGASPAVVALDDDGMACGWIAAETLAAAAPELAVADVLDEDIPTVPPDIPAAAAAQLMRDRGVPVAFLMHDWPGEPRPSALVALRAIEARLVEPAR